MAVRFDRKSIIFPASPSNPQHCFLTHSDLQLLGCNYIQKGLVYSMPNVSHDFEWAVEKMKKSLSDTLVHFYPLAGRLATSSEGLVYIDCNDRGADFIDASAPEIGLAEVMKETVGDIVGELFALNGALNMDGHSLPLLAVQVTKLSNGIVVGFTINHSIVDGTSLWHFINSWTQLCCQTSPTTVIPPLHTRCFGKNFPIEINIHQGLEKNIPLPLKQTIFHFTSKTISQLKEKANVGSPKDILISSFQALCAHVWQSITHARGLSPNELTIFKLAINCRPRIVPPLPYSYFGNVIQVVSTSVITKELLGNNIACVSGWLNGIISSHQDSNIQVELDKPPSLIDLSNLPPNKFMVISSSPRFPIYNNDFGWGRPIGIRSGLANKFDGKVTAYPGCEGDGSIDLEMCLLPQAMNALESNLRFHFPFDD